ncbi:hypothetical protein EYF80_011970 [Liparis tanakae]|uniref:Uncharacterized protein n=1 Tax=Liparis tanakae TaxID=230148 RepID=A0A4Z2IK72_9TELE|nr:hypothetical protein EYF80_011970 [Liparis tanakae]
MIEDAVNLVCRRRATGGGSQLTNIFREAVGVCARAHLRGGDDCSLGGQITTVQEDREGMDEGEQAEQRQTDVHLQTHGGREDRKQ